MNVKVSGKDDLIDSRRWPEKNEKLRQTESNNKKSLREKGRRISKASVKSLIEFRIFRLNARESI